MCEIGYCVLDWWKCVKDVGKDVDNLVLCVIVRLVEMINWCLGVEIEIVIWFGKWNCVESVDNVL